MINFLYILGIGSGHNDEELKQSIRTLKKHWQGSNYEIHICGNKPRQNVGDYHFTPCRDIFNNNKEGNILNKILTWIDANENKKSFVLMNDDYIFTAQFNDLLFEPKHKGQLTRHISGTLNPYMKSLQKTFDYLRANGYQTLNYDVHYPCRYDSKKFKDVFSKIVWRFNSEGFVVKSMYQNIVEPMDENFVNDCKTNNFDKAIKSSPMFSCGDDFPIWRLKEL